VPPVTVPAELLLARLRDIYPSARCELDWSTPVQMLVATILAAQCTDERVNAVTPALFARWPDAAAFAEADLGELRAGGANGPAELKKMQTSRFGWVRDLRRAPQDALENSADPLG